MKVIAIAGGSGSGKSATAYALVDSDPERFEVLHFDDYHRLKTEPGLPMIDGAINWDHPDIIDWQRLITDIEQLKSGQSVNVQTKDRRLNPNYESSGQVRLPRLVKPKPVLIVEGYFALYNPEVNQLYDKKFYLELKESIRNSRRRKHIVDPYYIEKVLNPMHEKYVEPTKQNADVVIDVASLSVEEVMQLILSELK